MDEWWEWLYQTRIVDNLEPLELSFSSEDGNEEKIFFKLGSKPENGNITIDTIVALAFLAK